MVREIYLLNGERYQGIKSVSVFEIEYLSPAFIKRDYDAIVFSSKNAVFGIDKIWKDWKKIPSYSIGEGTSEAIKSLGGTVEYEAKDSYGDKFALEIAPLLIGKTILFPRAQKVASNITGILNKEGAEANELIVYKTKSSEKKPEISQNNAILIFTSPSCVEYFFKSSNWKESFTAIAIGNRTAAAFPTHIKPLISPKQTIKACVDFAKTLSKNYI